MSRGLHCAWLVPRTRASSERHACRFTLDLDLVNRGRSTVGGLGPRRGYFLASWVRRSSPARRMRWFMKNRMFVQCALGFKQVLTTGCRNLCPMTPFKVLDSVS
ncbi:hypothetical protein M9H77_29419 [Catharanthus roseus]|uniref:Uncharacterized protein n=1 Tax=Catharanthus roseus TaxID=4058 RepID=A0ACB9ZWY6_CATRO|nr:hypothetical protein M9H77_29419 [Catharanthus roseus]